MVLAGAVRENPMVLAARIGAALAGRELTTGDYRGSGFTVAPAKPGFINIRLAPEVWHAQLRAILRTGASFGDSVIGGGERVNVEFVSANPTGPMHVGHCRGAVFGDALASLLVFAGYDVAREYYINDAGAQVDILARSAYLRSRALVRQGPFPMGSIPAGLIETGRAAAALDANGSAGPSRVAGPIRDFAIERMMAPVRPTSLPRCQSRPVAPSATWSKGAINECSPLEQRELIYTGVLEAPKGKLPDD
jgi:arginyl-tRNA synthetase